MKIKYIAAHSSLRIYSQYYCESLLLLRELLQFKLDEPTVPHKFFCDSHQILLRRYLLLYGKLILYSYEFAYAGSEIIMSSNRMESFFENYLFYVEIESAGTTEFRTPIDFQSYIFLRHKISNKYLSFSTEFEDEENDTTVKLQLSDRKTFFKILPCFQYQTKISMKIKFNEDVYLATELNSAKMGFLTLRKSQQPSQMKALIGLNFKCKIMLHSYFQREKQNTGYIYGQAVWLNHIQSNTFLTTIRPDNREEIMFEQLKAQEPLQSINGLWLIDSVKPETGGHLHFSDTFRLKSLCTNRYLAFSKHYKVVENQRIYTLLLEEKPSDHSQFTFRSLKDEESKLVKGDYLIFRNQSSGQYIGARRKSRGQFNGFLPVNNFTEFEDEDLFQIKQLQQEVEQAIRFIFSIRKQFKYIKSYFQKGKTLTKKALKEFLMLYQNIKLELVKLSSISQLFQQIQEQLGFCIVQLCMHIKGLRSAEAQQINNIFMKTIYQILIILCKDFKDNQVVAYSQITVFINDIFKDYGAEELICEIFRNNYSLLCKCSTDNLQGINIVRKIFKVVLGENSKDKNIFYWNKMAKIMKILQVMISFKGLRLDINQRLIASELFEENTFMRMFFQVKTINQRIRVLHPYTKKWIQIEAIRQKQIASTIEQIFKLFSLLSENRNFASKHYINRYINQESKFGIDIIISYLNVEISQTLTNNLFAFITNCYIDSSPRINRHRPLPLIVFQIDGQKQISHLSAQQTIMSGRLRDALLDNAQRSYATRPINNPPLQMVKNQSSQPSLTAQQLNFYKQNLSEKIKENNWSPDLLMSMKVLMQLESYSVKQIQEIKSLLNTNILAGKIPIQMIEHSLKFFQEVCTFCLEVQLKKINILLQKLYFKGTKELKNYHVPSFLPKCKKLSQSISIKPTIAKDAQQWQLEKMYIESFNKQLDILEVLGAGDDLKKSVLKMFIEGENYSFSVLSIIFRMTQKFYLPKLQFVKLLGKCIIIPEEERATYDELFGIYRRLKYLVVNSQNWMNKMNDSDELTQFLRLLNKLTNFLYEDLVEGDVNKSKLESAPDIKHQLLISAFSIHLVVIQLLNKNVYLLEGRIKKDIPKKQKQIFQSCFGFLFHFCYRSQENIIQLIKNIYAIDRYRKLAELGQIKLLTILYREDDSLTKQLNQAFFQSLLNKIVRQGKGYENCEYNPDYIQFLFVCCKSKNEVIKRNLEMLNKILQKDNILKKLLFMNQKNGEYSLCLDLIKFKNEPLQVPFIYHAQILKFFSFLIIELQSAGNQLKLRLKEYISIEIILQLLATPDIYTNIGLLPELNFLVKKELLPLLKIFLDKNDSIVKFHQNDAFDQYLTSLLKVFTNQTDSNLIQVQNQYLLVPFIKKYKKNLDKWRKNQRDYYQQQIMPLLVPFLAIFQKLINKEKNKIYKKLKILTENIPKDSLTHDRLEQPELGFSKITIRWRNFVDDDQQNSPEQKFAKKMILELLRSKKTYQLIEKQKNQFFSDLKESQKKFLLTLGKLVKMAVMEQSEADQQQANLENFHITVQSTADYLEWRINEEDEKKWEVDDLIITLINYLSRQSYNFNNPIARKSLYQILRIFNILLKEDKGDTLLKLFYKNFEENHSSFRFFNSLKDCILQASQRIDPIIYHEQINMVLKEVYICGQEKKIEIDKEALRFLILLCQYQPFTYFLRDQPYSISVDFLEKVYNSFFYIIKKTDNPNKKLNITIAVLQISQYMLECMMAFMNGCNQNNQNFIIDNKFTDIVVDALKTEKIKVEVFKAEISKRDRLLQEVINFYESNGINLAQVFNERVKIIDFRGYYILNRLKFHLLQLLLQCILANDRSTNKVRILVPLQLLKINLIWLYEDFIQSKQTFRDEILLNTRHDWIQIIGNKKNHIFLMIGFFYYNLIEINNSQKGEADDDEAEVMNDPQKQKQKIVKKFFASINEKDRHIQKIKSLEKESFADEMKLFYSKYYDAYEFFKSHTLTIEATVFKFLVKLYFPKLPIIDEFKEQMREKLIEQAERISQDEKLKSLMQFEEQSYIIVEGQLRYDQQINEKSLIIGKLISFMKNQQDIFFIVWILSCIVIIVYLIDDYYTPQVNFFKVFGSFFVPVQILDFILLGFSLTSMGIGFLIFLNLIIKKIPFLSMLFQKKYEEIEQKDRENIYAFKIKNIISDTILDIYIIIFSVLSVTHPLFSGFLTIYIIKRISIGKQIVQAIVQTWFSLSVATGLLVVFNYIYSIYIYSFSYTDDIGYGPACSDLFRCLLFLLDQSLKSGSGFLGISSTTNQYMVLNFKVLSEIIYILFAQKVIFEIFSGTIIDKFSQLRQKSDDTQKDEASKCFICGQDRFVIDFQLQGFEEHVEETHNKFNYIFYIYYLRRKNMKDYVNEEKHIWKLRNKNDNSWIPEDTSILKEKKEEQNEKEKEKVKDPQHDKYYEKKIQQLKKLKQRIQNYNNQLKEESAVII